MTARLKSATLTVLCLVVAAAIWLATVHMLFRPSPEASRVEASGPLSPRAEALLEGQLRVWEDDALRARTLGHLARNNPEWDLMSRTFLVLALGNVALRQPARRDRLLGVMDRVIDDTLAVERAQGAERFLLPYWRRAPFVQRPARSLFVEGEVAAMVATRLILGDRETLRAPLRDRVTRIVEQMEAGPVLSGESYPDECWAVCNAFALAALRLSDVALGDGSAAAGDHSALISRWIATARERLIDRRTGMLVSEYTYDGRHLDGPEGSSIFLVAHLLALHDARFAADQYRRAREALIVEHAGFAWAREWPPGGDALMDIDSGPTIPGVGANAGASGMAILGAAAFDDDVTLRGLLTSLELAGFPIDAGRGRRYAASNQVGDAVLLYALVQGPLWERARRGRGAS